MLSDKITLLQAVEVVASGMTIVLIALAVLALIFKVIGVIASARKKPLEESRPVPATPAVPGTKYECDDKTAALIMAIICDQLKKQPNELWFKSIKEL